MLPIVEHYIMSDLEAPNSALIDAVAAATGASDVALLSTWNECDKAIGLLPDRAEPPGSVNIEWFRRAGEFGLELRIHGHGVARNLSAAQLARRLAIALARPLLFSDCTAHPWSYLMARKDGAILAVYLKASDEDRWDLCVSSNDQSPLNPKLLIQPRQILPALDLDELTMATDHPKQCPVFGSACPRRPLCAVWQGSNLLDLTP